MTESTTKKSRGNVVRNVIIAVVAVVIVLAGAGAWAYGSGVITPANAAAKYGTFDYLDESEVSNYIMTYKKQMGYGDASDDDWAKFLASYNLTPDRLRLSTIQQILSDKAVEKRCSELGIKATDEEVAAEIEQLKGVFGVGGEDAWKSTLEMYGQSEEGLKNVYRLQVLREKLSDAEVPMPEPTDEQVKAYIASFVSDQISAKTQSAASAEEAAEEVRSKGGIELRHSYCFAIKTSGNEVSLSDSNQVELVKQEFIESGMDVENFVTLLETYSNDTELIEKHGAMGWDADKSDYSSQYVAALENTPAGGVSNVFTDGNKSCFIWVDQTYIVPSEQSEIDALDLNTMPSSLHDYFTDCTSYGLWEQASTEYMNQLVSKLNATVYPMPADVPYNVDMSAYRVQESE